MHKRRIGSAFIQPIGTIAAIFLAAIASLVTPSVTQNAIANGDTRTISLVHAHTKETITATFRVNGQYDGSVLEKLNWFLRDWRLDSPTKMDPRLFDLVWEAYRESGSREPIMVMSAYRSPQTNAMLRRRSRAVAEHSQHILGKAMDQHYMDVPMSRVREIGIRLQRGGVGYYPTANSPFVHLDVGGVRHWPRMSYDQLARIFPDGRTVHIPSNGQPLPGYEEARAQIAAAGGTDIPVSSIGKSRGFFAALFGGGEDEEGALQAAGGRGGRQSGRNTQVASAGSESSYIGSGNNFFLSENRGTAAPVAIDPVVTASNARLSRRGARPAAVTEVAATAPDVAAARPLTVAALPSTLPPAVPIRSASALDLTVDARAPLPPRRPVGLLASLTASDVPLPPVRPAEIGALTASLGRPDPRADAMAKLIVASNGEGISAMSQPALPDVILHGPGDAAKPRPLPALGYAAVEDTTAPARPVISARPSANVSAAMVRIATIKPIQTSVKIDRASLHTLTEAAPTERAQARLAIGAAAPPLRAAGSSRAKLDLVFADPAPGSTTRFDQVASSLPTDRFLPQ